MKKLTLVDFLRKAHAVWGDKYTYEDSVYVNARTKILVTCRTHGCFKVTMNNFIYNKSGCPICGGQSGKTNSDFIKDAKKIHGDTYDYSQTQYESAVKEVTIVCRVHGAYQQKPTIHLKGCGCPKCSKVGKVTTSEFIERSMSVHGGTYDYRNVAYRTMLDNVSITCLKHGDFWQSPSNHLSGRGCPKCGTESQSSVMRLSEDKAIEMCAKRNFLLLTYAGNATDKSKIKCNNGHEWDTSLSKIQQGIGCPACAVSGYNPLRIGYVYVLLSEDKKIMKIGLSNHPKKRIKTLKNTTPFKFSVIGWKSFSGTEAPKVESGYHRKSESACLVDFDGATEWFLADEEVLSDFR